MKDVHSPRYFDCSLIIILPMFVVDEDLYIYVVKSCMSGPFALVQQLHLFLLNRF